MSSDRLNRGFMGRVGTIHLAVVMLLMFVMSGMVWAELPRSARDSLYLHLDAGAITPAPADGAPVSTWVNTATAAAKAPDATAPGATKPTFRTNAIGGQPVIRFSGADDYYSLGNYGGLTAGEMFIVMKLQSQPQSNTDKTGCWFFDPGGVGVGNSHYTWTGDGNIYDAWGSSTRQSVNVSSLTLTAGHIYHVASATNAWFNEINGNVLTSSGTNTVAFGTAVKLGQSLTASFVGDMAEVVVYSRTLTVSERQAVGAYMAQKYGISTSYGTPPTPPVTASRVLHYAGHAVGGVANAGNVGVWKDMSGTGSNGTAPSTNPKLYTNALNAWPVVRFSGANSEHYNFSERSDFITGFWIVKEDSDAGEIRFLMGDNDTYQWHRGDGKNIWQGTYTHANIQSGTTRVNGASVSGTSTLFPTTMSLLEVAATGGCIASRLGNDRDDLLVRSWDGDMAEVILYNAALGNESRIAMENHLKAKYGLSLAANNRYDGDTPANGHCDFAVDGILHEGGTPKTSAVSSGMLLENAGFLAAAGDSIFIGHQQQTALNSLTTADAPSGSNWRWARVWCLQKADAGTQGGAVNIKFNYCDSGLSTLPASGRHTLLYRSGTSGAFTVLASAATSSRDEVAFSGVNATSLANGFYTLGFDNSLPTASIAPTTSSPTNVASIVFGVTFSEPVTGFDAASDVTVNGSGFTYSSVAVAAVSTTQYTVTVGGVEGVGGMSLSVKAGVAQDAGGNSNDAAGSSATVQVDRVAPNAPSVSGVTVTSNPRPTWSWTPNGGGNGTYQYQLDSSGWTETTALSFTPGSDLSEGTHRLTVGERDAVGNWSVSSFFDIFLDFSSPVIDVCPAPQSGECPATVANFIPGVTVHDNFTAPESLVIIQSPAAGTPVGLGPHTVTITVTDQVNHQSTCETTFTASDTVAPLITLNGPAAVGVECGSAYSDAGASASDACAGSPAVMTGGSVTTGVPGVYTLTYSATDGTNAAAEVMRVVTVSDTVVPIITLTGSAAVAVECGDTYSDAGATASDACAGSPTVTTDGSVNTGAPGAYTLTYSATDGTNAAAEVTRVVTVSDTTAPVITTCAPGQTIALDSACEAFVPDFTAHLVASDVCDTNLTVVQSPAAGTPVLEGDTVVTLTVTDDASHFVTCTAQLTVLKGDCTATTIPNVVGLSQTAAAAALRNAHLVVGRLSSHCGDADIAGMVVGQVPAASNDPVSSYSAVNLTVSQGRCQTGECVTP